MTFKEEKPWYQWYPEGIPKEIEIPEVPLFELLRETAKKYPDMVAYVFFGREVTFKELDDASDRFATALSKMGVKKGDKVALFLPNCPQFAIAYYGALKVGAIVTAINPLYKPREVNFQLKDSGAETIVALDLLYPVVEQAKRDTALKNIIITSIADYLPPIKRVLGKLLGKVKTLKVPKGPSIYYLMDLLKEYPPEPPKVEVDPKEDIAVLQYTGGTTGLPKGAMLTHYNLVANTLQTKAWIPDFEEGKEVVIGVLPWFHIYGQTVVMNLGTAAAAKVIVFPRFDAEEVMKAIQKYKATLFPAVATIYNAINIHPKVKEYDLSSLRAGISGAGPLPVAIQKTFEELTGAKICEGYGLTEASPVTHCNPLKGKRKVGSIGIPLPSTDAAIADLEKDEFLPPGEVGELVVKGPQVMKGYWNRPEETKNVFMTINGETWLRTGDIAKADEEGFFYIIDRKKDLIKYKGYSVYPREVEEVLYEHPAIKECAVVGVPDPKAGETIKAFVALKEEYKGKVTEKDIIEWAKERMAPYKYPRIVEFRDELPKTIVGKVLRRVLREEELKKAKST